MIMNFPASVKSSRCSFGMFWLAISVLYAVVFDGIEFCGSPVAGLKGTLTLLMQWAVVALAASSVIGILALNRHIFAISFPLLTGLSAIAAYFKLTLGMSITPAAVELAAVNELSTWATLISPLLIIATISGLFAGIAAAWWRYRRVDRPNFPWLWMVAFLCLIIAPLELIGAFRAPVIARMPYSFWFATKDYLTNRKAVADTRDTYAATPARCDTDSLTMLVVIGESLRPDHLSLNGYHRPTTPHLDAETTLVSVPQVWTDACYTHLSVPCIMTNADSSDPDHAFTEQSFITLFKKAGFATAWISNQDAVDSYAYFMHEADTLVQCNAARSLYDYGKWLDTDMLPAIGKFLGRENPRQLAVIHSIGSHWWYRSHYPDSLARFRPEINSRIVSELSREAMVNSYDNTVLATSDFLSRLIEPLRNRCAIIIFISDHGESLGEEGRFLHGTEAEELHHTACFVWYSPEYRRRFPEKVAALETNSQRQHTTEMIFHSALDGANIITPALSGILSIFTQ